MTCVHIHGCIMCIAESEPFLFRGKRYVVNKRCGPVAVDRRADPLKSQPSGRLLQAAYEHWKRVAK